MANGVNKEQSFALEVEIRHAILGFMRQMKIGGIQSLSKVICHSSSWFLIEFKSSVVSCKFHPSGRVVVTGSTDRSFKIFTCYIESADLEPTEGLYSDVKTLGKCLFQVKDNGSWILNTTFSKCG